MRQRVLAIIGSIKDRAGLDAHDDVALIDELGYSSLDVMELILALEQQLGVTFRDEDLELESFATVGAVLGTLRGYGVPDL